MGLRQSRVGLAGVLAALPCLVSCGSPATAASAPSKLSVADAATKEKDGECAGPFGSRSTMALDKASLRAKGAPPRLLARLDASAHRYYRLLAVEVASRVCFELRDIRWRLPVVAIHGDAHVEQFVVTPSTFGLEDYDQAGFGPAVVDLVRFATSLHLVCREVSWKCDADASINAFFRAYRESLDHEPKRKLPSVAERVRRRVPQTTEAWLTWADGLTQPLAPSIDALARKRWKEFSKLLFEAQPHRPLAFYDVVRIGSLQMGVGSALETKVLLRVRGATDSPSDDVILEARATSQPATNACAWRPAHGGSLHTLMFMSLLGPRMPQVFGTVVLDESKAAPEFWVQAWEPGYYELALGDIESQADLDELAVDAARQLAGHFWTRFPEPLRVHQRYAQLEAFDLVDARARALARGLADEVIAGWTHFRATP